MKRSVRKETFYKVAKLLQELGEKDFCKPLQSKLCDYLEKIAGITPEANLLESPRKLKIVSDDLCEKIEDAANRIDLNSIPEAEWNLLVDTYVKSILQNEYCDFEEDAENKIENMDQKEVFCCAMCGLNEEGGSPFTSSFKEKFPVTAGLFEHIPDTDICYTLENEKGERHEEALYGLTKTVVLFKERVLVCLAYEGSSIFGDMSSYGQFHPEYWQGASDYIYGIDLCGEEVFLLPLPGLDDEMADLCSLRFVCMKDGTYAVAFYDYDGYDDCEWGDTDASLFFYGPKGLAENPWFKVAFLFSAYFEEEKEKPLEKPLGLPEAV